MYRLVFLSGRYEGKRLVVRQATTVVGRGPDCHLLLPDDPDLAPQQARFEDRGTGVYLLSLDPTQPVACNGAPVREPVRLAHNDLLVLGQTRIQYQDIIAPHPHLEPSPGLLQPATFVSVAAILVVQILLVAFLVDWPRRIIRPDTEAADLARAAELRATLEVQPEAAAPAAAKPAAIVELPGTAPAPPAATNGAAAASAGTVAAPPAAPAEILQVLDEADFTPASPDTRLEILPPVSAADPQIEEAQRLLAEAVSAAEFADYAQAFRLLNQIHQNTPGFLPAHVEHARLLEGRGSLDAAQERWALVLGLAPAVSPLHQQAAEARERLARLQALQTHVLQAPQTTAAAPLPRDILITAPVIQKMPADADVAEMRLLKATLALAPDAKLFKDAAIQVFVTFYDADTNNQVQVTRAITTPSPLALGKAFADRREAAFDATYVVPRGLRAQEERDTGRRNSYYGFTLHVFAGQILQDAVARPKKLLDRPIHFPAPGADAEP